MLFTETQKHSGFSGQNQVFDFGQVNFKTLT